MQKALRSLDLDTNGSDGTITALAAACNYDTLYFTLTRVLLASKMQLEKQNDKSVRAFYKKGQIFYGFLKFVLDYHGGILGFLWL